MSPTVYRDRCRAEQEQFKIFYSKNSIVRITSNGQVTIPVSLRQRLGLLPDTEVVFEELNDGVVIRPASSFRDLMSERIRSARGVATAGRTTTKIMQLTRGTKHE